MKLDLGCGKVKKEGWLGIDIGDFGHLYNNGEFIQWNLSKGIPLEDNSVDELFSHHCIEHIPDHYNKEENCIEDATRFIMMEIHRVCKPKAIVDLEVPLFNFWEQHKTIFRKTAFSEYVEEGLFKELSRKVIWNHSLSWYSLFNVKVKLKVIK